MAAAVVLVGAGVAVGSLAPPAAFPCFTPRARSVNPDENRARSSFNPPRRATSSLALTYCWGCPGRRWPRRSPAVPSSLGADPRLVPKSGKPDPGRVGASSEGSRGGGVSTPLRVGTGKNILFQCNQRSWMCCARGTAGGCFLSLDDPGLRYPPKAERRTWRTFPNCRIL